MNIEGKRGFLASLQVVVWMCGSLRSSDNHDRSGHLDIFAKFIQSMDGGNLASFFEYRFFSASYPILNIGTENLRKQNYSNDGNLAPPQTEYIKKRVRGCIVKS